MNEEQTPIRRWSDVARLVSECRTLVEGASMGLQDLGKNPNAEVYWLALLEVRGRLQRAHVDFMDSGTKRSER